MNWTAAFTIAFGIAAFPLCVIGLTALAGGMLMAGRISREEEQHEQLPPCWR
jgi:hypothetical protein